MTTPRRWGPSLSPLEPSLPLRKVAASGKRYPNSYPASILLGTFYHYLLN